MEKVRVFLVLVPHLVFPNDFHITFKLNKLLHVPPISKNLLSVSQFAKDNAVFFEFHPHLCLVKLQGTNKVLLQGAVGADGLYSFHNIKLQHHRPQYYQQHLLLLIKSLLLRLVLIFHLLALLTFGMLG